MSTQIGIGILRDFAVFPADRLRSISLKIDESAPEFAVELFLVVHEDVRRSPSVRAVADYFGGRWKEWRD